MLTRLRDVEVPSLCIQLTDGGEVANLGAGHVLLHTNIFILSLYSFPSEAR
jgi:hypothetical protein